MPNRSIAHLATELYLTENHPHVFVYLGTTADHIRTFEICYIES